MSYITELAEQAIKERQQRSGLTPITNPQDTPEPAKEESTSNLIQRLAQQAIKERVQAVGGNVGYKDTFYPAAEVGPTQSNAASLHATDKNTPLPPQPTESVTMDLGKPAPNAQQQAIQLESQMQWRKLNSLQTTAEKEAYLRKIEDQQRREERMVGIDRQKMQDDAIKKEIRGQQDQVLETENRKIGLGEQASRFQNYKNSIPFLGSVNAAVETYDLNKAIERVASGQTKLDQEKFLKSYLMDQAEIASRGKTFEAQVFDSTLQTLPYMIEWAKTAGIQAVTRSLGRKLTLKLIGPIMRVATEKLPASVLPLTSRLAVGAVDLGKAAGTATGMTIGSPGRIAETYQQMRMPKDFTFDENGKLIIQQPGDGPMTALTRSVGYNLGQNLFELSGETAVGAIKGAAGAAGKGVAAASRKIGINPESLAAKLQGSVAGDIWAGMVKAAQIANSKVPPVQTINKALKSAHWDGFIGENLEEFLGNYYTALTDTNPADAGGTKDLMQRLKDATMTKEQIAVQMATLAIPGMTTAAVGTAVELHDSDVLRDKRDKAKAFVLSREGAQWLWQQDPRYAASLAGAADAPSRTQIEPLQLRMNIDERRTLANNLREIGRGFLNQKLANKASVAQQEVAEQPAEPIGTTVPKTVETVSPKEAQDSAASEKDEVAADVAAVSTPANIDEYEDAPQEVYRVETGYKHDRDTTAADVVRYEQETKGNQLGVPEHIIEQLENRKADDLVWFTQRPDDAMRYATNEDGDSAEAAQQVETHKLPKGAKTIARDTDGGILVLMPPKAETRQPPKTEPLAAHDFKEGQRVTFSDGKGGMLTGTIRSFGERNGEPWASIDTDQIAAPGGVPIGRIENRPVRNLKKLQQSPAQKQKVTEKQPETKADETHELPQKPPKPSILDNLSAEKRAELEKLKKQFHDKLRNQVSSGIDPEIAVIAARMGMLYVEAGAKAFNVWAKTMVDEIGDSIKPYLRGAYLNARNMPGMEVHRGEMSSAAEVDGLNDEDIEKIIKNGIITVGDKDASDTTASGPALGDGSDTSGNGVAGETNTSSEERTTESISGRSGASDVEGGGDTTQGESGNDTGTSGRDGGEGHADTGKSKVRPRKSKGTPGSDTKTSGNVEGSERTGVNHVISSDDVIAPRGEITQTRANIAAIRLLKQLETENRDATPEEQQTLAQFTGWGNLSQLFDEWKYEAMTNQRSWGRDEAWEKKWGKYATELHDLLTKEELDAAAASTLNAHYTARTIIESMWQMADRLGFKGGTVLEPGAGVGHFFGLMPQEAAANSKLVGIELDSMTGRLLGKLYPEAKVFVDGFENVKIPNNSVDLVITNVPFAQTGPADAERRYGMDLNLHNYFFARSLDTLRPGGLMIAITTHFTMDAAKKQRELLAQKGELIAAIRLPNNAFKENAGTEVTTDIIILRKPTTTKPQGHAWANTAEIKTEKGDAAIINEYFVANPDMMLGVPSMEGSMYARDEDRTEFTLQPKAGQDLAEVLKSVLDKLPLDVMGENTNTDIADIENIGETKGLKEESVHVRNGKLVIVREGKFVAAETLYPKLASAKNRTHATHYIGLRNHYQTLISEMLSESATDEDIAASRKKLNTLYDDYNSRYGYLNEAPTRLFSFDPGYWLLRSLEKTVTTQDPKTSEDIKTVVKADVFTRRTIEPRRPPLKCDTVKDALRVSLCYQGQMDIPYIVKLTDKTREEVEQELVDNDLAYENPETGLWETTDAYLSGNVRAKLDAATVAAQDNPKYQRNLDKLKSIQPPSVAVNNIYYKIGGTWIPADLFEDFAGDILEVGNARIKYVSKLDGWIVSGGSNGTANTEKYGTPRMSGMEILGKLLNLKTVQVWDVDKDGKRHFNQKETVAAQMAAEKIETEFKAWIKRSEDRTLKLQNAYNEKFNWYIPATYNGDHLELPGASNAITLRPYQKNAVWRLLQIGYGMIAHAVGAGKTMLMAATAMEMKRLRLANKPMLVVDNATLDQFATQFRTLYPTANLLVCQKDDLKADNRKTFLARMAAGDYDSIIIAQSSFNLISNDPDREVRYVHDLIDELRDALHDAEQREGKRGMTVKMIQRQIRALLKKLDKLQFKISQRQDSGYLSFEQLGIDALFVDEAHRYKKPPFTTKLDGKIAGLSTQISQRATNLMLKCRWVQEGNGGKNVFLASGTPVSNTLGEAWHMLNYVAPNSLKEFGVDTFDRFISTFAVIESSLDMNAAQKWVFRDTITKFVNGPQLLNLIRQSWDVVSPEDLKQIFHDLNVKLPQLKNGKTTIVNVPLTKSVEQFNKFLEGVYRRYEQLTGEDKRLYNWVPIVVYGAARSSTLDIRLVYPSAKDDPGSKVNRAVENAYNTWLEHADLKGTQLIFSDSFNTVNMTNLAAFAAGANVQLDIEEETTEEGEEEPETLNQGEMFLYNDIKKKLIAKGIPADEIVLVKEVAEKDREALFEKVNNGRVRILIGGTSTMGVGVNVQKRLCAIHHLDSPWVPADLEQRLGRMVRQGNTFTVVEEFGYGMEKTLDAAIYTKILRKARATWQALAGKVTATEFDDPASPLVLSAKEQQAFLSGDPRIFEKIELERDARQLRMESEAFEDSKARQRVSKDWAKRSIESNEKDRLPAAKKFSDYVWSLFDGSTWKIELNKETLTDPLEFGQKLAAIVKPTAERIFADAQSGKIQQWKDPGETPPAANQVVTFTINGARIEIYASGYAVAIAGQQGALQKDWRQGFQAQIWLPDGTYLTKWGSTIHTGHGFLDYFTELPNKAQQDIRDIEASIKRSQQEIKELDALLEQPWSKQQQLDEIEQKLNRIEGDLTSDGGTHAFESGDPFQMPVSMEPNVKSVSNHEIIATLSKDFNVPLYPGRVSGKPAGIYKHIQEIIRIKGKYVGDLSVATHEVAHHIDKLFGISNMDFTREQKAELKALDYLPLSRIEEGFAEFIRHLLTEDDAAIVAPNFYRFFNETFLPKHKALQQNLLKAKNLINQWRGQGFEGRVHGYISWTGKKAEALGVTWQDRIKECFIEGWHKFYTAMKDQGHYLDLMVRDAARRGYKTDVGDDAYAIFKAFTQSGPTLAMTALEKGVFKLSGEMEKIGPSLHEIFEKIEEKGYERFVEWIWSRHAIEAWSKGKNPGGSLVDAHAFYQKYRSQEWEQAAQKLTDFNNSLIVMLADAGVITPKAAKAMIEYYQTYIPLMRVKNPMKRGRFGGKKLVNLPNPVHGRHGSGEQVLDPIQSTIERAIRMYERASQQIVINKAVQMAHKADGIGTWIHNVPPDFRTTGFTVGEIEDQLAKVGIDIFDYEELVNQRSKEQLKKEKGDDFDENEVEEFHVDPQELLYVYRPDYYYKGSEPIAQVIVNGKPKLYQFDKDLFRAISGMNYFQLPYFMDLLMGKGTRMIRMGATGINIGFAERNVIKDAFTYLAQSNESLASTRRAIPLPAPGTMMGAYIWSETQKLLGNEADPVVELWQQMGGELSQTLGLDRNQIRKAVKDVVANSTQRRLLNVAATPLETMRQIIGVSEVSPRLSEFYAVLERHGYTRARLVEMRASGKRPPRHILVEASNAAADVTTDFKRQGWLGKWLNRVSPYWNAPLEGFDKYIRTWKSNPKRAFIFTAAYAAARIAYWMMVKDEDWYKEQPKWLKYGFWTIAKDGKPWLRIPVPHLWGYVVGGGIEAILNTAEDKNPKELAKWFSQMAKDTIPDFRPSVATQALEAWANYDLFRRQPIVDETLSRRTAEKQYTAYNTKTMVALGRILHLSPAKLEHFIDGISGGIYRQIAKPVETLASGEPVQPADIPGLSGLALRQDYSESTQEFYDRKDQIEKKYNSAKDDGKVTPELDAQYHRFQDYADLMSQMRAVVKTVADRDKRFEVEKYIVGLARASLGKKELDRYPNPILAQDVPQVVRTACDNYLGTKLYQLTMPTPARELGETTEHYQQRRQRYEVTVNRARQILGDLDIPMVRLRAILQKETRSRGLKTGAISGTHPSAYSERLSRLRKESLAVQ